MFLEVLLGNWFDWRQLHDSDAGAEVVEATPSKVSGSIAPVAQVFDGEKYAPTKLAHNTDYFIVYFTASW